MAELKPGEEWDRGLSKHVDGLAKLEEPALKQQEVPTTGRIGPNSSAPTIEQTKQFVADADGFYQTGRYDLALKRTEQILNADPYNIEARKMQEKINKAVDDYGVDSYNETRSRCSRRRCRWAMTSPKAQHQPRRSSFGRTQRQSGTSDTVVRKGLSGDTAAR